MSDLCLNAILLWLCVHLKIICSVDVRRVYFLLNKWLTEKISLWHTRLFCDCCYLLWTLIPSARRQFKLPKIECVCDRMAKKKNIDSVNFIFYLLIDFDYYFCTIVTIQLAGKIWLKHSFIDHSITGMNVPFFFASPSLKFSLNTR